MLIRSNWLGSVRNSVCGETRTRRTLNPTRREDAVGIAVDQQGQHEPRVILRLAAGPPRYLKGRERHTLDRSHHEMRQVVIRQPGFQVRFLESIRRLITPEGAVRRLERAGYDYEGNAESASPPKMRSRNLLRSTRS